MQNNHAATYVESTFTMAASPAHGSEVRSVLVGIKGSIED